MHRWAWIALSWLCAVAPVAAQPGLPLELDWRAPPECASAAEVRAELERIARVREGYTLRPLTAAATVTRKAAGFRVVLRTEHEGRSGERTLEASDCKTLARSVTLVLALAFGPAVELAEDAQSQRAPQLEPETAPTPEATREPPSESEPQPVANAGPSPLSLTLMAAASGNLNLFPSAAPSLSVGLQLRFGNYAAEVRGFLLPRSTTDLRPNIQTELQAVGGSLAACRSGALSAAFELTLCAGARLASLTAESRGDLEPARATAPWTALTAGASVAWPRSSWLRLRLELAVALSLSRPRFVVEALGDAHRVPLFVPDLGLGLLLTF